MATILIVDDDPLQREIYADMVQALGHRPVMASHAVEGVRLARREQPALILLDLFMPPLGGLYAGEVLQATLETRDIPIVAMSAHDEPDPQELRAAGCRAFHRKPLVMNQLREVIVRFVGDATASRVKADAAAG